jgi:hypothetical protein
MSGRRTSIATTAAASSMLALALSPLGPGCGPAVSDVDKAALYTPESLANELAFRFRGLSADAKVATVRFQPKSKDYQKLTERLARSEQAKNKVTGGPPEKKKKKAAGPPTIDDLLADIDNKLNLLTGISRADACRKMIETISGDNALSESDKKRLTELVGRLQGSN